MRILLVAITIFPEKVERNKVWVFECLIQEIKAVSTSEF